MISKEIFLLTTESIAKTFDTSENIIAYSNTNEELKEKLTKIIAYLLDNDFEKLIAIMYRIDINENKFKQALNENFVAEQIADLVIKRFILKAEIRLKYNSKDSH